VDQSGSQQAQIHRHEQTREVEYGIVSKRSNELRIQDIRSINLTTQGLSGCSESAGSNSLGATEDADVIFWNCRVPRRSETWCVLCNVKGLGNLTLQRLFQAGQISGLRRLVAQLLKLCPLE